MCSLLVFIGRPQFKEDGIISVWLRHDVETDVADAVLWCNWELHKDLKGSGKISL